MKNIKYYQHVLLILLALVLTLLLAAASVQKFLKERNGKFRAPHENSFS